MSGRTSGPPTLTLPPRRGGRGMAVLIAALLAPSPAWGESPRGEEARGEEARGEAARGEAARGGEGGAEVTLAQVLRMVRERSPRLAAEASVVDIVDAERVEARIRPNPEIEWIAGRRVRGVDHLDGTEMELSVGVPIEIGGKRRARIRLAERLVAAARADVAVGHTAYAQEAAQIYAALSAAQERVRVFEQAVADIEDIERVIIGRAQLGASSRYHVERTHLEVITLRTRLAELHAEREDIASLLARAVGAPGWRPGGGGALAPLGITAVDDRDAVAARLPLLAAKRSYEQATEAAIAAARTLRWPDPEFVIGALSNSDPYGLAGVVGVSIPIPVFDRGQGELARARAEARTARLEREAATAESLVDLERARRLLDNRRAALRSFEEGAIARLPALRRMAEQAYLQGESGIGELLDTIEAITETMLDHIGLVEGVLSAEIDYLAAAGRLDELSP
jgi:outer membrane protein, heavy metal efflux system